jgi:hypothetical protein
VTGPFAVFHGALQRAGFMEQAIMDKTQSERRKLDLFSPQTGAFAVNIRDIGGDDSELRSSLKEFGWVPKFPALADENDVVLVGHRRLKIATEEKIEPVIEKLTLGKGDAADAERLKLALVSNIGSKPMTKEDRKRIAEHLYGSHEWTMENIAEALNVAIGTVHKDLAGFSPSEKPSRPKGGRPKGSGGTKRTGTGMPSEAQKASDRAAERQLSAMLRGREAKKVLQGAPVPDPISEAAPQEPPSPTPPPAAPQEPEEALGKRLCAAIEELIDISLHAAIFGNIIGSYVPPKKDFERVIDRLTKLQKSRVMQLRWRAAKASRRDPAPTDISAAAK